MDRILEGIEKEPGTVYMGTDAAKPEGKYQATCAALLYRQGVKIHTARHAAGKVLPSEAELHAIRSGLVIALQMEEVEKIVVFTDSMQQAKRALQ